MKVQKIHLNKDNNNNNKMIFNHNTSKKNNNLYKINKNN